MGFVDSFGLNSKSVIYHIRY